MMKNLKLAGQVLLDVACLIIAFAPFIGLSIFAQPFHRGFYCDDQSIRYPYKSDTVTNTMLLAVCYILPLFMFSLVESIRFFVKKRGSILRLTGSPIMKLLSTIFKVCWIFVFGSVVTLSITTIGKYTIGRLRPHFLSVCQPLPEVLLNCTKSDLKAHLNYITEDTCTTSEDDKKMINARMSFPSGHSSAACYTAVFVAMYLNVRLTWKFVMLLRPCLQALLIFGAVFVCLSRVSDNRHHWSDVLAGAFLGCFIAALTCIYVLNRSIDSMEEDDNQQYEVLNDSNTAGPAKANHAP